MNNLHQIFQEALAPFAPKVRQIVADASNDAAAVVRGHDMTRTTTGCGMGDFAQVVCSCGWKGPQRYGYEDYQYTSLRDDERGHRNRP